MSSGLPDEVLRRIGVSRTRRYQVTARDIKRFAQAIGATDPVHFDEVFARSTRYGGIVAPPLFCQSLTYDDVPPEQLPADGSPVELAVPIPAQRAVGGGSEYTIQRLVRPGDVVTVTSTLKEVYTKEGKSGLLYLVVVETRFVAADGEPLASEIATYIKRV
jgi:acyl dehydratase